MIVVFESLMELSAAVGQMEMRRLSGYMRVFMFVVDVLVVRFEVRGEYASEMKKGHISAFTASSYPANADFGWSSPSLQDACSTTILIPQKPSQLCIPIAHRHTNRLHI